MKLKLGDPPGPRQSFPGKSAAPMGGRPLALARALSPKERASPGPAGRVQGTLGSLPGPRGVP